MNKIKAIQLIKGFISFLVFNLFSDFRLRYKKGSLWSKDSFATIVGFANSEISIDYTNNQKLYHSI